MTATTATQFEVKPHTKHHKPVAAAGMLFLHDHAIIYLNIHIRTPQYIHLYHTPFLKICKAKKEKILAKSRARKYNKVMIILGIDYGDSRTGIARVNTTCPIVTPVGTIKDKSIEGAAQKVAQIALSEKAEKLVLGLPRNMDGSEGPRAEKTRHFGELLSQFIDLEIIFSDERLSSSYAHNIMNFTDTRGKKRKESVDALAATIILQTYVDSLLR